ncbi:MAG: hypothetical protein KC478_08865, partial [Bacteriovoracaceae bacterium]|nr:hypothetical protein [Bacteriovoracaceae bacterium]
IYAPEHIRPRSYDKTKLGSHEDIFPTLYNLALSDTPFVAFGEDLFSPSESYALGASIYASKEGLVYRGEKYNWGQMPKVESKSELKLDNLYRTYRSSLSVADFYLRQLFNASRGK